MTLSPTLLLLLLLGIPQTAHNSPLVGHWRTPGGSVVEINPCGSALCLKLVKVSPNTPESTDRNNPDKTKRDRPLCGLQIGEGFTLKKADEAEGGSLYDPESGRTYSGTMDVNGDDLKLRGYIGISLLGRTEHWHRTGEAVGPCRP